MCNFREICGAVRFLHSGQCRRPGTLSPFCMQFFVSDYSVRINSCHINWLRPCILNAFKNRVCERASAHAFTRSHTAQRLRAKQRGASIFAMPGAFWHGLLLIRSYVNIRFLRLLRIACTWESCCAKVIHSGLPVSHPSKLRMAKRSDRPMAPLTPLLILPWLRDARFRA